MHQREEAHAIPLHQLPKVAAENYGTDARRGFPTRKRCLSYMLAILSSSVLLAEPLKKYRLNGITKNTLHRMTDVRWEFYPQTATIPLARTWLQMQADLLSAPPSSKAAKEGMDPIWLHWCQCLRIMLGSIWRQCS